MSVVITAGDPRSYGLAFKQWLFDHGIEADGTYQVDVNEDEITVHEYKRDADGYFYVDGTTGDVAVQARTVPLKRIFV